MYVSKFLVAAVGTQVSVGLPCDCIQKVRARATWWFFGFVGLCFCTPFVRPKDCPKYIYA